MTNCNKRLDEIFPDESKDTGLQRHLRNVWHDNFSEQEFIDEMEAYITATHDQQLLEAILDGSQTRGRIGINGVRADSSYVPVEHIKSVFKKEGE